MALPESSVAWREYSGAQQEGSAALRENGAQQQE